MEMGIQPGPSACLRRGGVLESHLILRGGCRGEQNSLKENEKEVAQGKRRS